MRKTVCLAMFVLVWGLDASNADDNVQDVLDPVLLLGITPAELYQRFGTPVAVYSARGDEPWQDDVMFEYPAGDFYLYNDRVWQISLKQANGVKVGDAKMTVTMAHGSAAEEWGAYFTVPIPNRAWPVAYRYNIDAKGKISAIYLYRADY